jgi:ribose-phosphate pyrophosphokinase
MRQVQIFSGSSHPTLVDGICERLGQTPGKAELRKFSNGETSVQIREFIHVTNATCRELADGMIRDVDT